MKLRAKITLIIAGVVAGYALLDHALQRWILQPRFDELERRTAQTDAQRVRRALTAELAALEARCSEWAAWNETCAFVAGSRDTSDTERARHVADFRDRNLGLEAFRQSRIDLLYLVDSDGSVRFGRVRDLESGAELKLAELNFERLNKLISEAAEQSGRIDRPDISEIMTLSDAIAHAKQSSAELFFGHIDENPSESTRPTASTALFIGPEGSWSEIEITQLQNEGVKPISLGQFVLRAETAAIVGISKLA